LFLQGCTIFTVFVSNCTVICFEPLKNLILRNISPNYKLDSKTKPFDDENLVLALFILCSLHSYVQIQHGGFIRAFLFSIWTPVTWPSTHSRSNISMLKLQLSRTFLCKLLISNSMVSHEIWINMHSWVFQRPQNSTSPKDECYLRSLKNSRVHVNPNFTRNHAVTY
jgi:hypothetical protein